MGAPTHSLVLKVVLVAVAPTHLLVAVSVAVAPTHLLVAVSAVNRTSDFNLFLELDALHFGNYIMPSENNLILSLS